MTDLPIIKAGTICSVKYHKGRGLFHADKDTSTKSFYDMLVSDEEILGLIEGITWIYIPEGSTGEFR